MATEYKHTIMISVDAALRDDANQLALAIGESVHDDWTFMAPQHTATDGSPQCLQETRVTDRFIGLAADPATPLVAPAHAPNVDLAAAERARALMTFTPPARVGAVVVILNTPSDEAYSAMGVEEMGA